MATYYIAPETGNDANPGTSESAPRKTPPSASNGDVWLMKRGETYTRASQWGFGAATAMTLDAYGDGGYPVVTITATANTNAFNIQGDGTNVIRNIWFKDCSTNTNGRVIGFGNITALSYFASGVIEHCKFTGCNWNAIGGGATTTATASKRIVVKDCIFDDIGEDCFYGSALYLEIGRCRMTKISSLATTGDGIGFLGADPDLVWIYQNYIDHSDVDVKQCIIIDTLTNSGLAIIEDNILIGFGSNDVEPANHAVIISDCQIIARRNFIQSAGLALTLAAANSQATSNVFKIVNARTTNPVVAMTANTCQVVNNTFISTKTLDPTQKIVVQGAAASNGVVHNNVFADVPIAIKSDNAANNPTSTFNAFYNVTSPRLDQANAAFAGGNDVTLTDLNGVVRSDGSLIVPNTATIATVGTDNPLATSGTYVPGVTLRNGRLRPGYTPIGAYMAVVPRAARA